MGKTKAQSRASLKRSSDRASAPSTEGRTFLERLGTGVWGLAILLLAVLLSLSLLTFAPEDRTAASPDVANLVGPVGAWLSYLVFYLIGIAAYILAAGCLWLGGLLVAQRALTFSPRHLLGFAVILLPAMVLLHLALPDRTFFPRGGGGLVGTLVASGLQALIHTVGTIIVAVGGVLVGISLMFHVHASTYFLVPLKALKKLSSATLSTARAVSAQAASRDLDSAADPGEADPGDGASADPRSGAGKNLPEQDGDAGEDDPTAPSRNAAARKGPKVVSTLPDTAAGKPSAAHGSTRLVKVASPETPGDGATRKAVPAASASGDGASDKGGARPGDGSSNNAVVSDGSKQAGSAGSGQVPIVVENPLDRVAPAKTVEDTGKPGMVPLAPGSHNKPMAAQFALPDLSLLEYVPPVRRTVDDAAYQELARTLREKLMDFKVDGEVESIHPGPVITLFEFKPGRGIKVSQIANLSKDLAMALAAEQVRVIAPIPGRDVVGIEIPNKVREMVYLRELIGHGGFKDNKLRIPLALGKDIAGNPVFADLTKMPHLLVAGTTGSGKSVLLHAFIMSMAFRLTPRQLRFIFVDTKMLELTAYAESPHLFYPVVTDAKEATAALRWAVGEMERRNRLMSQAGVPNLAEYNDMARSRKDKPNLRAPILKATNTPEGRVVEAVSEPTDSGMEELPYIVVVIDELADLMMVAGKQVETSIVRLAQMARAAGIHMIIATQNPTIKVVTGIIKANMPSRISCKVRSMQDSRVVLDQNGADDLLGWGDMLFLPPGSSKLQRIHGAFVSTEERLRVVEHLRTQGAPEYNLDIMQSAADLEEVAEEEEDEGSGDIYRKAKAYAIAQGKISTSQLQREFGIGYNKAAVIMSRFEKEGLVGPQEAAGKPRVVLA